MWSYLVIYEMGPTINWAGNSKGQRVQKNWRRTKQAKPKSQGWLLLIVISKKTTNLQNYMFLVNVQKLWLAKMQKIPNMHCLCKRKFKVGTRFTEEFFKFSMGYVENREIQINIYLYNNLLKIFYMS